MADDSRREIRQCPTRIDGGNPLIVQAIGPALCQTRQAQRYHKCSSCLHARAGTAPGSVVVPSVRPLDRVGPVPPPVRLDEYEAPRREAPARVPSAG
jgi:hypothetical protein